MTSFTPGTSTRCMMLAEHLLRARDRQVADVEMSGAGLNQRADRPRAHVFGLCARAELARQAFDRDRQEAAQRVERLRVGAAVIEDAEDAGQGQATPRRPSRRNRATGAMRWWLTTCVR